MRALFVGIVALVMGASPVVDARECVFVEAGDTLEGIVVKKLHLKHSDVIRTAKENGIKNPDVIFSGRRICFKSSDREEIKNPPKRVLGETAIGKVSEDSHSRSPVGMVKDLEGHSHVIRDLGVAPFETNERRVTQSAHVSALRSLGYSQEDSLEMLEKERAGDVEAVDVPHGSVIPEMVFRGGKKRSGGLLMNFADGKHPVSSEKADKVCARSGKCVYRFRRCHNPFPTFSVPKEPENVIQLASPPPRIKVTGETPKTLIEYEANAGVFGWKNGLAHGGSLWGEALLWTPSNEEGLSAGGGIFVSGGTGESKTSAYQWDEGSRGVQVAVKQNYLGDPNDEGKRYPRNWQIKARLLHDQVEGENPESGYSMSQKGPKVCAYGEYIAQTDEKWKFGITGEGCVANNQSITSTWSGDTPQDRGSFQMSIFAQRMLTKNVAVRGILGASHQNWDKLNLVRGTVELRYEKDGLVVAAGPTIAVPIGKIPVAYQGISRSKLVTPGALVRVEFGGKIRETDAKARASRVSLVSPGSSHSVAHSGSTETSTSRDSNMSEVSCGHGWGDVSCFPSSHSSSNSSRISKKEVASVQPSSQSEVGFGDK